MLLASPGASIVYLVPSDESMVARSPVIALGRIDEAEVRPGGEGFETDVPFRVSDVLKGAVPSSTITVRRPGGMRADGLLAEIQGLPSLTAGDRVLLFLRRDDENGVYRIVELGLGLFYERTRDGRVVVEREPSLEGAGERPAAFPGVGGQTRQVRNARRFRRWIVDRASGTDRPPDYLEAVAPPPDLPRIASGYRLIRSPERCERAGLPLRWREFDEPREILLTPPANGFPGLPGDGLARLRTALAAWNNDNGSRTRLALAPSSSERFVASEADGVSSITWEDPHDEIAGTFSGDGGVLAITWVFFYCDGRRADPHRIPSRSSTAALSLVEANITTQDGYGDWLASLSHPDRNHEEVMAHELGHALGISHACGDEPSGPCDTFLKRQAIMRAAAHADGRGAALTRDDRDAVRFLYPVMRARSDAPAAPTDLDVTALGQHELSLTWRDRSDNEHAFDIFERPVDGDFSLLRTVGPNTTSLIVEDLPAASYRAYQVRARNDRGNSQPTREVGATTLAAVEACFDDDWTLCLNGDRFRVTAAWRSSSSSGRARAVKMTRDTGYFWFFDQDNLEVVVKALNACAIDGSFWILAAGLTDLEVVLTASDSTTGAAATFFNEEGNPFDLAQDRRTFQACPRN